jgi:hypothetical protein
VKKIISKRTDRGSEQFQLRLPGGMRKQVARAAERSGRSMNAEIVNALALYFEPPGSAIEAAMKSLEDKIENQHRELVALIEERIK